MLFLHQIFNSVWLMEPGYATNYIPLISSYIKGERMSQTVSSDQLDEQNGVLFASKSNGLYSISDYGNWSSPEEAPKKSIAVVSISGAITKHDQACGPSGMATKASIIKRCYANPDIEGIVIKQDTGGGEVGAMRLFNETISLKNKPVIGFIEDLCCSAGVGNFAACDMIVANSILARIGSIGVYSTIIDYSEKLKNEGINLIDVYASASTDKNSEYREAINGNVEPLRAIADKYADYFLDLVENQRGDALKEDRKVWGTGKVFFAEEALKIGLIDAIDSFDNILNYF